MNNGMKIEIAIMFLLMSALGTVWYFGYIKPMDDARAEIVGCMQSHDDLSRESYEACAEGYRNKYPR